MAKVKMTLGEWLQTWLMLYVEPSSLAKSTKQMYNRSVRAVPEDLRKVPMSDLTDLDLMPWLLDVARVHPRAAQLDRQMLHRALKVAGKLRLCRRGLVDPDTCPRIEHKAAKAEVLDVQQLRDYYAAAVAAGEYALAFCCCGLRRSEARGVTWGDIDFRTGILTVNGQRRNSEAKKPCKTASSVRAIVLPAALLAALRPLRGFPGVFVCPYGEKRLYEAHRRISAAAGVPVVHLHGLRHSVATACVRSGDSMKAVQGLLGHADFAVTANVYADHFLSASDLCEQLFL